MNKFCRLQKWSTKCFVRKKHSKFSDILPAEDKCT